MPVIDELTMEDLWDFLEEAERSRDYYKAQVAKLQRKRLATKKQTGKWMAGFRLRIERLKASNERQRLEIIKLHRELLQYKLADAQAKLDMLIEASTAARYREGDDE